MNNLQKNIKSVMIVFLALFVAVISYMSYYYLFKSEKAIDSVYNKRTQAENSRVLRGTIYDRDMNPLTIGEKTSEFSQSRQYVGGEAFSHVVGYYDAVYGASGIEKKFDKELSGQRVNSLKDIFSKNDGSKVGNHIVTSLDSELQKAAYDLLGDKKGSIVVLNPSTGEVLAMVSKPSFDPNTIQDNFSNLSQDENTPFLNRAVSGLYPPGSTFKVITGLSAIENISDVRDRTFKDEGRIYFNDVDSLENYKGTVMGNINLRTAFLRSSNVVFGTLAMELGNEKLRETAEKFFFNKEIPSRTLTIDDSVFPKYGNEEAGNIAQSGIGQSGVLASPIEMALIASAIANDGVMMEPNIVKNIVDSEGKVVKEYKPQTAITVTTPENAQILKEYMKAVVNEGTGTAAGQWGVQVSGKTGTADTDIGNKIPHSWFIGFAGYDNPEIAFAIVVEEGGNDRFNASGIAGKLVDTFFK